jgi:Protein of unknown function (DUF1566)
MMNKYKVAKMTSGTITCLATLFVATAICCGAQSMCENVGDVCSDGTIYAGQSVDRKILYTTPDDAPSLLLWNAGKPGSSVAGADSSIDGRRNTRTLTALSSPETRSVAASYCANLRAYGHDDWYLPASKELSVLYNNHATIGKFDTKVGARYWSSSEASDIFAWSQNFNDGFANGAVKNSFLHVRCVRN